jgi:hypothetical protein
MADRRVPDTMGVRQAAWVREDRVRVLVVGSEIRIGDV